MKNPSVLLYRLGNFFYRNNLTFIATLITWLNRFVFAVFVPSSATIGANFRLAYWGLGVVIHTRTVIGDNCLICQNVTIGRNFGSQGVPRLGNDVYVGAGSAIFGDITIGDNVIIGANSVVNKDVPSNSVVAGNPFRIIASDRKLKYYELDNPSA
ncbi:MULTISPECIES: serine O-acetyltransferase [Sorangium]|uniref:O-acetyltransferase n=1 Tax=Sorangium cellulosum (strain So ce56) TaxID=448385 RepID=A9EXY6_SORC5|nr:serine acetyltransferase [Sorangium cellulosum]CAN97495.1 O-acetyltransferase [Sorangium cellulosum So ce56]